MGLENDRFSDSFAARPQGFLIKITKSPDEPFIKGAGLLHAQDMQDTDSDRPGTERPRAWSDRLGWSLLSAGVGSLLPNVLTNGLIGYQQIAAICFLGATLMFTTRVWRIPGYQHTRLYLVLRFLLPGLAATGYVIMQTSSGNLSHAGVALGAVAAIATALTSDTDIATQWMALAGIALIGAGIGFIGAGAALLTGSETAAGIAGIGIGIGIIGYGTAQLAGSETAANIAGIGAGIASIGYGTADLLASSATTANIALIGAGIAITGYGSWAIRAQARSWLRKVWGWLATPHLRPPAADTED